MVRAVSNLLPGLLLFNKNLIKGLLAHRDASRGGQTSARGKKRKRPAARLTLLFCNLPRALGKQKIGRQAK
jgi:hypothetical protein